MSTVRNHLSHLNFTSHLNATRIARTSQTQTSDSAVSKIQGSTSAAQSAKNSSNESNPPHSSAKSAQSCSREQDSKSTQSSDGGAVHGEGFSAPHFTSSSPRDDLPFLHRHYWARKSALEPVPRPSKISSLKPAVVIMPADNGDGGGGGDDGPPPWAGQHKNGSWPSNAPWFPNKQPFWSSSSSSYPAGGSPTPTPFGGGVGSAADKDTPSRLGHEGLMAAVIVPVVLVLLSVVGLVFLLARRRRRRGYAFNNSSEPKPPLSSLEMASTSSSANIINEAREYRRPPSPPPQLPPPQTLPNNLHAPAPIIISTSRNSAYLTGLDTGSEGSQSRPVSGDFDDNLIRRSFGGTFAEPPPPYVPKGQGDDAPPRDEYFVSPIEGMGAFGRERVQSPFGDEHAFMDEEDMGMADGMQYRRDPFEDPESPVSEAGGLREGVRPSGMREL